VSVVSNASPLSSLDRLGYLELLRALEGELLVPHAVWYEVVVEGAVAAWRSRGRSGVLDSAQAGGQPAAEAGEPAASGGWRSRSHCLRPKMRAELLLMDERVGHQVTHGQGMRTVGPLDVLLGHDPNGRALAGHAPRRPRLSPGSGGHRLGPSRRRRSLAAQPGPQGGVAMLGAGAGATTHGASALQ
jgi:hypothetical protein